MLKNPSELFTKTANHQELPRERLLRIGVKTLSDQELLAIILRTGYKQQNVMNLAFKVLEHFDSLYELKTATLEELQEIKGIGEVKAIEIHATIELGNRLSAAKQLKFGRVYSSQDLGQLMISELKDLQQEHLMALYLNTKNEIIQKATLFIGGLNQSIAHPREIFRLAVRYSAARVILVHNHPSGNVEPSRQDIEFTERVHESGQIIGIQVLDHIIVGNDSYLSFKEENVIF